MHSDKGRGYYWLTSSPSDVKLSVIDFFRMADVLRDERLTPAGLRKMKTMYETSMMSMSMCFGMSVIPALGVSYLFSSRVRKSHSGYRFFWPLMAYFWPFCAWRMCNVEIGRRIFTEVLADDGEDGAYIRETLKEKRPGLWKGISNQLYKLDYQYPEINEVRTNLEFPTYHTKF